MIALLIRFIVFVHGNRDLFVDCIVHMNAVLLKSHSGKTLLLIMHLLMLNASVQPNGSIEKVDQIWRGLIHVIHVWPDILQSKWVAFIFFFFFVIKSGAKIKISSKGIKERVISIAGPVISVIAACQLFCQEFKWASSFLLCFFYISVDSHQRIWTINLAICFNIRNERFFIRLLC